MLALRHRFRHPLEEEIREKPPVDHEGVSNPTTEINRTDFSSSFRLSLGAFQFRLLGVILASVN